MNNFDKKDTIKRLNEYLFKKIQTCFPKTNTIEEFISLSYYLYDVSVSSTSDTYIARAKTKYISINLPSQQYRELPICIHGTTVKTN